MCISDSDALSEWYGSCRDEKPMSNQAYAVLNQNLSFGVVSANASGRCETTASETKAERKIEIF